MCTNICLLYWWRACLQKNSIALVFFFNCSVVNLNGNELNESIKKTCININVVNFQWCMCVRVFFCFFYWLIYIRAMWENMYIYNCVCAKLNKSLNYQTQCVMYSIYQYYMFICIYTFIMLHCIMCFFFYFSYFIIYQFHCCPIGVFVFVFGCIWQSSTSV